MRRDALAESQRRERCKRVAADLTQVGHQLGVEGFTLTAQLRSVRQRRFDGRRAAGDDGKVRVAERVVGVALDDRNLDARSHNLALDLLARDG